MSFIDLEWRTLTRKYPKLQFLRREPPMPLNPCLSLTLIPTPLFLQYQVHQIKTSTISPCVAFSATERPPSPSYHCFKMRILVGHPSVWSKNGKTRVDPQKNCCTQLCLRLRLSPELCNNENPWILFCFVCANFHQSVCCIFVTKRDPD